MSKIKSIKTIPKPLILVVDDNHAGLYATSKFLTKDGFDVITACTAGEALEKVELKPDVILLDVKLPDMDGFEVCRRIKARPDSKNIPIIHLSSYHIDDHSKVSGLEAGADSYLTLPIEPKVLKATINAMLRIKRIEEELKQSAESFKVMANAIPQLAWIADADGYIYWYNDRWYEYTGTTPEQMEGWGWQRVHDPEILPQVLEKWKSSIHTGEKFDMTFPLKGKDGIFRPFLTRVMPLKSNEGKVIQWFGTNTDITDQINTEKALEKSQADLKEAQKLAHIGNFTINFEENNRLEWSEETFNIFGMDIRNGYPILEEVFKMIHRADLEKVKDAIQRVTNELKKIEVDYRIITPANDIKYLHSILNPVLDSKRRIIKLFGTSIDVTESMNQQEKINATLRKLERSNEELEQFAFAASHDLREPLRTISNFTSVFSSRYKNKLDETANTYLSFIEDGSKRMQILIEELLSYARITSNAQVFQLTNLNKMMEYVMSDLKTIIEESKASITFDELPVIKADPVQIKQLFQNLISNAIKFRNEKDPAVHITAETNQDEWLFKVSDNGIGIDLRDYEKIFVIFKRLHDKDEYTGTGIGLAICKKIVELHGGRIWVDSEPGKGSTFQFYIPRSI